MYDNDWKLCNQKIGNIIILYIYKNLYDVLFKIGLTVLITLLSQVILTLLTILFY